MSDEFQMKYLNKNDLQFSVVREDPQSEVYLFKKYRLRRPILIGSGGCTAFTLACHFSDLPITLIEPNPAQVALIYDKISAFDSLGRKQLFLQFGVGTENRSSLIELGNFESLFRSLRQFIFEFIISQKKMTQLLKNGNSAQWKKVFKHPYWSVAFKLFFDDSILLAMFGPNAIQHGHAQSYSQYFQKVFEKGLLRKDRGTNYFLYHLLLGHYPKNLLHCPDYLMAPPKKMKPILLPVLAQDVVSYADYDFVGLSNIFDWSSEPEVAALAKKISQEISIGSFVVYRQLNNNKDFTKKFGSRFEWLTTESQRLLNRDRSLFYSSLHIGRKIK